MQLFILNPAGESLAFDYDESTLVKDVVDHVTAREKLPKADIRLTFAGLELSWQQHRDTPLGELGVQPGSTLHLSLSLKGAATGGKAMKGKAKEVQVDPQTRISIARAELKHKLEIEAKNTAVSKMKIQNQWRKIMRMTKTETLKKDIEILSQNHEREVDRKDAILQMLDRDLEEAEDQHLMMARTHLQHLDNLMELYDSKLLALESEFKNELQTIMEEFDASKAHMLQKFNMEKEELLAIIAVVDQEEFDRETEAKQAHEQLCEEIKNKNLEEINMLRIGLDAQIEELEQQFEAAHLSYLQQTGQRTHEFKELTRNDQKLSKDIDVKRKTIDRLQGNIQQWRTKVMQLQRETDERTRVLREEKGTIQKHYQQLKRRIAKFRDAQQQRLLTLTEASKRTKTALSSNLQLAEDLLRLYEHAKDLETEQEQVLPFQAVLSLSEEEQMSTTELPNELTQLDKLSRLPHQSTLTTTTGEVVPPVERLRKFYQRMNRVTVDKAILEKERDRLAAENAQLHDMIEQYREGLTINPELLKSDNPLLVINGRASLNRPLHLPKQPDHIFKQEAAHTIQYSESQMP